MKRLLLISVVLGFISCSGGVLHPIEKYGGGKYVITYISDTKYIDGGRCLRLKNADTIFNVYVLDFDLESRDLKVGDTIK